MCGIAGVLRFDGRTVSDPELRGMIEHIRHRGPDACGQWSHGEVGLAHARLSIIDVSGGAQPMSSRDGTLRISFNGEIFNYLELRQELIAAGFHFETQSDTEVILHMYAYRGEKCVEYFNGQWAFAIWDARARKLFLSRDRFGIRPLFYTLTPDCFLFASEIKALLAHPDVHSELDVETLDQVFTFWSPLPGRTMFKGVREVPVAHSMEVERGRTTLYPYWQLDYSSIDHGMEEEGCATAVLELLSDATRIRLRSDVPVGAYLSGGLDSSIIAALASKWAERPRTFSVTFEDKEFDESGHQAEVIRFLNTEHRSVRCSQQDICDVFPEVIRHTEMTILRTAPAPLYLLSRLVHQDGFKVVLTGEGADEFFGGYDIFKEAKIRRFWSADLQSRYRPMLLRRLYPYMPALQAQSDYYRSAFFRVDETEHGEFFSHLPRWELTTRLKSFFSTDVRAALNTTDVHAEVRKGLPAGYATWDGFSQAQYLEATGLLPGYLLSSQGDRVAMAHAVEGRFPFLDYRLVDFTTRIPPRLKMKVLNEKYILKKAAGHLVPPSVQKRSKQPYRAPDAASFFDPVSGRARAEYVEELLGAPSIRKGGVFNPAAVEKLVEKARRGRVTGIRDNMALVGILSTQLLMEQFIHHAGEVAHAIC